MLHLYNRDVELSVLIGQQLSQSFYCKHNSIQGLQISGYRFIFIFIPNEQARADGGKEKCNDTM